MKICSACKGVKAWRYINISGDEEVFYKKICSLFCVDQVQENVMLCYNCRSFMTRVNTFVAKLRSPASLHEAQDNGDGIQCKRTDSVSPASLHEAQDNGDGIQCKRTDGVLPSTSLPELNTQDPVNITSGVKRTFCRCPDLLYEMMNVSVKNPSVVKIRNITSVVLAYSALMFSRNNKNSAFQRCTTLMAVAGNSSDEFIRRLNQMGISLSCTSKLRILEKAGETSKNLLVEKLKTNPRMKITGDNLDMYIKTNHQRQDNDNKDIHWFASNAFLSRLDYTGLSLEKPNVPLGDISPEFFIPNNAEKSKLRDVKKVFIGRMIVDKKDFDWLEKKLPTHIPHRYSEYMSKKQEVFSLPIIFKNESKNEDCLDIMDAYERQLTEIFTLAHGNTDMLQKHGAVLGGDQLTRERLQNVKNIRFLALTPEGRFEHLNPIVIEHWHVKQDLLSKAYKALYTAESLCTPGTLFHAKTILEI
ncbi:uncharacterized protein LOC143042924 [Mytilus galloprovincialis]|uniref:uncharacterized protein LOC143042924 n=1 Tax=Mytilus galloprovincialis TaxID=29158 RepID=UPI003F7B764B